jgi:hypothetical protein
MLLRRYLFCSYHQVHAGFKECSSSVWVFLLLLLWAKVSAFSFIPLIFLQDFNESSPTKLEEMGGGATICTVLKAGQLPAMSYCSACPLKELLSSELLAIPDAAAAGILLNVHKTLTLPVNSRTASLVTTREKCSLKGGR